MRYHVANVVSEPFGVARILHCRTVDIALNCLNEICVIRRIQRIVIGLATPVERLRHLFHSFAHTHVANTHLAQILIQIVEHHCKQRIGQRRAGLPRLAQSAKHQPGMQNNQVEAAFQGVRHIQIGIERWQACLGHCRNICSVRGLPTGGTPAQAFEPTDDCHFHLIVRAD